MVHPCRKREIAVWGLEVLRDLELILSLSLVHKSICPREHFFLIFSVILVKLNEIELLFLYPICFHSFQHIPLWRNIFKLSTRE